MPHPQAVEVIVAMDADKANRTTLSVKELNASERALQAGKVLGLCLLAGVAFVFIPVLHFFLVPGAVIVGFAFAYRQFTLHHRVVDNGKVTCPACQASAPVDDAPFNFPKTIACPACQARLLLRSP